VTKLEFVYRHAGNNAVIEHWAWWVQKPSNWKGFKTIYYRWEF